MISFDRDPSWTRTDYFRTEKIGETRVQKSRNRHHSHVRTTRTPRAFPRFWPDKKINKSNIIVQLDKKLTGWVNVDLSTFEISTKEDIVITVEWIEHSKNGNKLNLPIIIPSFGSTHYYKLGSQGNWQKYKNISSSMILTYKQ